MPRRLLVGTLVVLAFAGAGAALALATRDDDTTAGSTPAGTSASTTTPRSTTTTGTPASTSAPTTVPPASTSATTPAVPDPCGGEGASIGAAIDHGVDGAADRAQIDRCRLAAVDSSWAAAHLVAKAGATFDPVTVVLHGGGGSWSVIATGTDDVGCGSAPQQVLVDLGILCSSRGGA